MESATPAQCADGRRMKIGEEDRAARTQKSANLLREDSGVLQVARQERTQNQISRSRGNGMLVQSANTRFAALPSFRFALASTSQRRNPHRPMNEAGFRSELCHPAAGATAKVEDVQSFDLGQKPVEEALLEREHRVGFGVIDRRRQAIAISRRDTRERKSTADALTLRAD